MEVKRTSIASTRVTLSTSPREVLGPNPRRRGLLICGATVDFSLSWSPQLVLGFSSLNFYANIGQIVNLCSCDFGTALTQPLFGVAASAFSMEITEIFTDEPTGSDF